MWRPRNDLVENIDDENICLPIELTEGEFSGTIISFGKVEFEEPDDGSDEAILHFDVEFHENPHNVSVQNEDFVNHCGEILVQIIEHIVESEDLDENRGDNTIESTE